MTPHPSRTTFATALFLLLASCDGLFERNEPRPFVFEALDAFSTATFFSVGDTVDGRVSAETGVRVTVPVRVTNVSDEPTAVVSGCPVFRLLTAGGRKAIDGRRSCLLILRAAVVLDPGESWVTTAQLTGCFVAESSPLLGAPCDGRWMVEHITGRYRWDLTHSDRSFRHFGSTTSKAFTVIDPRVVALNRVAGQ